MARRQAKQADDDGPPGPAAWLVTFSDCMTLLLCFFVMLVSFSSFDEASLKKLGGAFKSPAFTSVSDRRHSARPSLVPPKPRHRDVTQAGSRVPTNAPPKNIQNPREPRVGLGIDAYRDRHILHLPSGRMFYGNGSSPTEWGRECLQMVASFMSLVPCDAIVAELPGDSDARGQRQAAVRRGLSRSWSIVQHFTAKEGLPASRFHVSIPHGLAPGRFGGRPVMEITLLARSLYR
jgi:flagellar motor protein MotB